MNSIINITKQFLRDEDGATAVEYGLMAALIAGVIVGIVTTLGGTLSTVFSNINTAITPAG